MPSCRRGRRERKRCWPGCRSRRRRAYRTRSCGRRSWPGWRAGRARRPPRGRRARQAAEPDARSATVAVLSDSRGELDRARSSLREALLRDRGHHLLSNLLLLRGMIKDAGSVLCSRVIALPIERRRIVDREEHVEQQGPLHFRIERGERRLRIVPFAGVAHTLLTGTSVAGLRCGAARRRLRRVGRDAEPEAGGQRKEGKASSHRTKIGSPR